MIAACCCGAASAVEGQGVRTQVACNGQPITEIIVRSQAPSFGGWFARSQLTSHLIDVLHVTTAPEVIEHFVLLKKGEACSPVQRYETERVLRAQPFLADASVTAYPDGSGVRIEVVTIDEPSAVASLGVRGDSPYLTSVTAGNANVAGKGVYAVVGWRAGFHYRDTYQVDYANHQMFGAPYLYEFRGVRRDLGHEWETSLTYPYFTDGQRFAWQMAVGSSLELVGFRAPGRERSSLGSRRIFGDVGGVVRVGRRGRLGLVGASISTDRMAANSVPVFVTDSGLRPDSDSALVNTYGEHNANRLNLLLGFRSVQFMEVNGFDALTGRQDVRTGVQIGTTIGAGIPDGSPAGERMYGSLDVYGGLGSPRSFAAVQARIEGRRMDSTEVWDGLLMGGRFAWYLRPHPRHTILADIQWASGRRQLTPFQLSLADRRGGVRGYEHADVGGGRRVVGRLEERWRVGSFRGTADGGVAVFGDLGRLWSGDAPLGMDTPWLGSIGVGLLAAIPPRSQRMWRLDIALPLRRTYGARWELRFTNEDRTRTFWREPNDIRRNRERSIPASVFQWP
ncbi:MAG: hypothetical protein MNPFHGCM_01292 [Gemmatimonadaceae bacterium]|nr:hypothetical protein [Gemmatimonadaceae bacterium]